MMWCIATLLPLLNDTVAASSDSVTPDRHHTYVLVAGIVGGTHGMTRLAARLERDGHRVVVLDPYEMSLDSADVSFAALARRVDRALESRQVWQAHVVGHGHGGGVALRLAATHPVRVGRLTLLDAGAVPVNKTKVFSSSVRLIPFLVRIPGGRHLVEARFVNGIKSNLGRREWFDKETQRLYVDRILDTRAAIALASRLAGATEPEPVTDVVARVRVPVQVILGSTDRSAAPNSHDLDVLKSLHGGFHIEVLDGIGHFPHEEATEEVARLLGGTTSGRIKVDTLHSSSGAQQWPHPTANRIPTNWLASFHRSSTPSRNSAGRNRRSATRTGTTTNMACMSTW